MTDGNDCSRCRADTEGGPCVCEDPVEAPIIYCFLNGGSPQMWRVMAIADDGHVLAGHLCSSPVYFKHDLGIGSDWKHDKYREHYPDGYVLEWVDRDDIAGHEGLQRAFELGHEIQAKEDEAANA